MVTAAFSDRQQIQPVSWGATIFNDRGTKINDTRNYVEAAYTRELSRGTLQWRTYYDEYKLSSRFDYPLDPSNPYPSGVDYNRQVSDGKWIGSQLTYRFDAGKLGTLTAGAEGKVDFRAIQSDEDISPLPFVYLNTNNPDRSFAVFAQDERKLSPHWTLDFGGRFDYSYYRHSFISPRMALIYQPVSGWTYKFLYGRSFRNPSAFELFYGDGLSGVANPAARPEKADTVEIDVERKIGKRLNLLTAAYGYRLQDFLVGKRALDGLIQYQNIGRIHAMGFELELNGRPSSWLEATASYSIQRSTDDVDKSSLANSPDHLAKLRFAIPLGRKFEASGGVQYYSSRTTLAAATVAPVFLSDFTVTSRRLLPDFDVRFGLRNTLNRSYSDPIALNPLVDAIRQPGRSIFLELIAHARE